LPCVSATQCEWFSTGILVEQSDGVRVTGNISGNNQVNIYENGNGCEIKKNRVYGSVILAGIEVAGDDCRLEENWVINSAMASIVILGNGALVRGDKLIDAPIGILKSSSSVDTTIAQIDFINIGTKVVDPGELLLGPVSVAPVRD
jgi:nitrous oxidase accessory protein NosD